MKFCFRLFVLSFVSIALYSAEGQGQIVIQHTGYNDPLSEGFTIHSFGAVQVAGVTNDSGYNAWATLFSGSGVVYSANVGNLTGSDWVLSVTVKIAATNANPYGSVFDAGISTGTSSIGMAFGADSNGNQLVLIQRYGEFAINGSSYNNYQLVYDATANAASLWINGMQKLSGITGFVPSIATLSWGGGYQSPSSYQANWNLVSLEIVPEPGMLSLICFGGGALLYVIRRRHR